MGKAKSILIRPISSQEAAKVIKSNHYSGRSVQNSQLHVGVFYNGKLEGAMQFGPPIDKRKVMHLVKGTKWNQMLELNRMAFSEALPRNSDSRAMAVAFRMIKKHRPDIKWVLSFADGTQCGDGTIYRASGFVLTGIKKNTTIIETEDGRRIAKHGRGRVGAGELLPGFMFRYIRFVDPSWASRLTVPVIPFEDIPLHAKMVRGESLMRQSVEKPNIPVGKRRCNSDPVAPSLKGNHEAKR